MRIAIDAHTLEIPESAGKEQYLHQFLRSLKIAPEREIFIYLRRDLPSLRAEFSGRFNFRNADLPTPFWQIWLLWRLRHDCIERIIFPCVYLAAAFNFFIKQTVIIHDLTAFLKGVRGTHTWHLRLKEKLVLRLAIRNSQNVIAISQNTSRDISSFFPEASKKISVVYQGCRFPVVPIEKLNYQKLPTILVVGTIEPRKNIIAVVEAFEELKKRRPEISWKLGLIGRMGWKAEAIKQRLESSPCRSDIEIRGYLDDDSLLAAYQEALCLVYPSVYEGFGLPPLEAFSNGCPVIISDNSSLPEVGGKEALYIGRDGSLAELIIRLHDDGDLRKRLMLQGLSRAKIFDWNSAAEEIIKIASR